MVLHLHLDDNVAANDTLVDAARYVPNHRQYGHHFCCLLTESLGFWRAMNKVHCRDCVMPSLREMVKQW